MTLPVLGSVRFYRGHEQLDRHSTVILEKKIWYPSLPLSSPCPPCPLRLFSSRRHFPVALVDCCVVASHHWHPPSSVSPTNTYGLRQSSPPLNLIVIFASFPLSPSHFQHLVDARHFLLSCPPSSFLSHLLLFKSSSSHSSVRDSPPKRIASWLSFDLPSMLGERARRPPTSQDQ